MNKKIGDILEEFSSKKILVMGDVMLDKFSWGDVGRVNPEQPAAPLVRIYKENFVLGGAANVANNLACLGAKTFLYGIIGRDGAGNKIKKFCDKKKINFKYFYNNQPTILKQRIMAHGQQITRLDFGEKKIKKINEKIQNLILRELEKEMENFDYIILSDYNKSFFSDGFTQKIMGLANSKNIGTLVDPKPANFEFFKNCSVITPNKHEAVSASGIEYSNGKETLTKIAEELARKINSKYVIITCGKDGMFSYDAVGKSSLFIETVIEGVGDVTGAGDSFAATLALGLACGLDFHEAAKLSEYAAEIVVRKIGTSTLTTSEIRRFLKDYKKI